ncbi:MAG: DNA-directed RNA polymerase subunit RpoH/Rpb5 C-terminal domain-containing protein [Candidatus Micrarchaeaceae archaeon]
MVSEPMDLIPKHVVVSASEAKKIAKKFTTTLDKFPKILESDPQVKSIGAKAGDLVAIHRTDPTGKYVYYRLVVKG